jgi:hypothetical protein
LSASSKLAPALLSGASRLSVRLGLGRSSRKTGSGEFVRLRFGCRLSLDLTMLLCHSFRQVEEAEIC